MLIEFDQDLVPGINASINWMGRFNNRERIFAPSPTVFGNTVQGVTVQGAGDVGFDKVDYTETVGQLVGVGGGIVQDFVDFPMTPV